MCGRENVGGSLLMWEWGGCKEHVNCCSDYHSYWYDYGQGIVLYITVIIIIIVVVVAMLLLLSCHMDVVVLTTRNY